MGSRRFIRVSAERTSRSPAAFHKSIETMHLTKNVISLSLPFLCSVVAGSPISFSEKDEVKGEEVCADAIESVLATLGCIERKEAVCAARGYALNVCRVSRGLTLWDRHRPPPSPM